jgi:hypothetical protein
MQKVIKFSHVYTKMPEAPTDKKVMLLEIFNVESKEALSKEFINYDTQFFKWNYFEKQLEEQHYPLPNGKLMVLLLMFNSDKEFSKPYLFTTIRRHTPEKEKYYRELRGQTISIMIIKEDK